MALSTVVGLDLETTALEPSEGEILEVAAIRYDWRTGKEVARFVELCRASGPLPLPIQQLTGITDAMLTGKPFFGEIRQQLKRFIGNDTIFAHNAPFDVSWLSHHGLRLKNPVWDTFPLASISWPEAPSYNLGMLARQLQLPGGEEHRAAGDVGMAWELLQRIKAALVLTPQQEAVVGSILTKAGLRHYAPLFSFQPITTKASSAANRPVGQTRVKATIQAMLGQEGILTKKMPGFLFRAAQQKMAELAYQLFEKREVGLLEAGTGLGKTYAYLAAGLQWLQEGASRPAGRQLVISTRTRYLQDQLLLTDLPQLLRALKQTWRVASLKGRKNYVCSQRLQRVIAEGRFDSREAWLLLKLVRWLDQGGSGDLERLNFSHQASLAYRQAGSGLLNRIHADALSCRTTCRRGTCRYPQARSAALEADFLVVNHALLVHGERSDEPLKERSIVIDEAHHLAEAARSASARHLSLETVEEVVAALERLMVKKAGGARSSLADGGRETKAAFRLILDQLAQLSPPTRSTRLLLSSAVRRGTTWQRVRRLSSDFEARLQLLVGWGRGLQLKLSPEERILWREAEEQAETFLKEWRGFVEGDTERLQWLEFQEDYRTKQLLVEIFDVARDIQGLVAPLFNGGQGVVLTSATLRTAGTFTYIKETLGLTSITEQTIPSPFNYQKNMLIYVVEGGPNPVDSTFDRHAACIIEQVGRLLAGHTMVLLTSRKTLHSLYTLLSSSLYKANLSLLAQGLTGGRRNVIERFKANHNAVLLGTASFWEGLDLPGENVSALIVPRLPFPPPDDPVTLTAGSGYDTFLKVSLPQMLLRLRQGVGRLIRTETDRGVVVLLDPRFLGANYRAAVLATLPAATIKIGPVENLSRAIGAFLGKEQLQQWHEQHQQLQK